jgi:hypothetical protein
MHLFDFQPGDGTCYTFLFGRLPATSPFIEYYTVFGYRDDYTRPLLTYPFDNERISFDIFASRLDQPDVNPITLKTAWRIWCELVDSPSEGVADQLSEWRPDWRAQLPRR